LSRDFFVNPEKKRENICVDFFSFINYNKKDKQGRGFVCKIGCGGWTTAPGCGNACFGVCLP
jgi:hypothetical protein